MKKTVILILFICIFSGLFLYRQSLTGKIAEPKLEAYLSDLFGLNVTIDELLVDPVFGHVTARYVAFDNPNGFSDDLHIEVQGLKARMDVRALKDKRIHIWSVELFEPQYLIERKSEGEDATLNNIQAWRRHMKARPKRVKEAPEDRKPWTLVIENIYLDNGIFRFVDYSHRQANEVLVSEIQGKLTGLTWPNDSKMMPQYAIVDALYGVKYPARAHAEGKANFVTRNVSFDLKGEIPEGNLLEYDFLFQDLPLELIKGSFQLKSHTKSNQGSLVSSNEIILKKIDVTDKGKVADRIWGAPMLATIAFIEEQDRIELVVPVSGRLSDPNFKVKQAFRKAFQKSLKRNVDGGVKAIQEGAVKVAQKTGEAAKSASEQVVQQFENLGKKVSETVPVAAQALAKKTEEVIENVKKSNGESEVNE